MSQDKLLLTGVRGHRAKPAQIEYLVDYMVNHSDFARGRLNVSRGNETSKTMWETVADTGNQLGPVKTIEQWKKLWKDIKSRCRAKISQIKSDHRRTGNLPNADNEPLTDLDRKVLSVIGSEAVEGLRRVPDSLPNTTSALRELMAGNRQSVKENPAPEYSVFEELNLHVPVTTSAALPTSVFTVIASGSAVAPLLITPAVEAQNNKHTHTHFSSTCTTSSFDDLTTPFDNLTPTRTAPITKQTPKTHININSNIPSEKEPTRRGQKRPAGDRTAVFADLQDKQNEIMETMAEAMLITAKTAERRLNIDEQLLAVKIRKLDEQKKSNDLLRQILSALKKDTNE